jgi:hypothetical protein
VCNLVGCRRNFTRTSRGSSGIRSKLPVINKDGKLVGLIT